MPEIVLPDGQRFNVNEPVVPTPVEEQMLGLLNTIARLIDMLVRLECGVIKRADLKADILATEAAIREAQAGLANVNAEEALAAAQAEDAEARAAMETALD
jgi:F0F1-type ATP synthase epsilon subunit